VINPFACDVLSSQLVPIKSQFKRVEFTGEHADKIAL
jgi:hypothetical protein